MTKKLIGGVAAALAGLTGIGLLIRRNRKNKAKTPPSTEQETPPTE